MKNLEHKIQKLNSVAQLHASLGISSPKNPMITIIDHAKTANRSISNNQKLTLNLYNISIKRSFKGKLKYGKSHYDFDNGTLSFMSPNQIMSVDHETDRNSDGWSLLFHPDLIRPYALGKAIKNYGFFSYDANEALHLSDEEETTIQTLIQNIQKEISSRLDYFSQDLIVHNLELLLSYSNRFYNRQFITRKMGGNNLLSKFELLLDSYFQSGSAKPLPTVEKLANELGVSSSYLSDMLRSVTGQNTQQHIHEKLIAKAKDILITSNYTVSEIAYQLGFEYPQSFSKLFKAKTNLTPLAYRQSFN